MASARFWIVLFLGLSLCFFAGCTDDAVTDQNVLVQVGDWRLYRNDIPLDVYEGKSIEDSTREVKLYIENWVRSALLYRYAEQQILPPWSGALPTIVARSIRSRLKATMFVIIWTRV